MFLTVLLNLLHLSKTNKNQPKTSNSDVRCAPFCGPPCCVNKISCQGNCSNFKQPIVALAKLRIPRKRSATFSVRHVFIVALPAGRLLPRQVSADRAIRNCWVGICHIPVSFDLSPYIFSYHSSSFGMLEQISFLSPQERLLLAVPMLQA